jgi:hypothetical protein
MRESIKRIKERISDKENCIYGWRMRIMQGGEDVYYINRRLLEFRPILKEHENDLVKLKGLLANRQGVKDKLNEMEGKNGN